MKHTSTYVAAKDSVKDEDIEALEPMELNAHQ